MERTAERSESSGSSESSGGLYFSSVVYSLSGGRVQYDVDNMDAARSGGGGC
jgi:hypothetical protein